MSHREGYDTCTFCHRQALMTEAWRQRAEQAEARVALLEAKLKKRPTRPTEQAA